MAVTEQQRKPALSVYELTLLFDDWPTAALVERICEDVQPVTNRDLLYAMFRIPPGPAPIPHEFAYRVTDEQARMIDLGLSLYRKHRFANVNKGA